MSITVQFDLPINISESLHSQAEEQAKIAYIMTLLKHGEISSGVAGKLLGISRLEVLEQGIVAKAWMEADCYSLVFENVTRFVKEGEPVALYYQEQAATFRGIAAMHDHARSQEIPAGEIITQLKIQEGTT